MPAPSTFYARVFALIVTAALGYALLLIFSPFIRSMAWAGFLAFLLYPVNLELRRRFRGRASAAGLLTLLAPLIILLPLSALSIMAVTCPTVSGSAGAPAPTAAGRFFSRS